MTHEESSGMDHVAVKRRLLDSWVLRIWSCNVKRWLAVLQEAGVGGGGNPPAMLSCQDDYFFMGWTLRRMKTVLVHTTVVSFFQIWYSSSSSSREERQGIHPIESITFPLYSTKEYR